MTTVLVRKRRVVPLGQALDEFVKRDMRLAEVEKQLREANEKNRGLQEKVLGQIGLLDASNAKVAELEQAVEDRGQTIRVLREQLAERPPQRAQRDDREREERGPVRQPKLAPKMGEVLQLPTRRVGQAKAEAAKPAEAEDSNRVAPTPARRRPTVEIVEPRKKAEVAYEVAYRDLDEVCREDEVRLVNKHVRIQGRDGKIFARAAVRQLANRERPANRDEAKALIRRILDEDFADCLVAVGFSDEPEGDEEGALVPAGTPAGPPAGESANAEPAPTPAPASSGSGNKVEWFEEVALEADQNGYTGDTSTLALALKTNFPDGIASVGNGERSKKDRAQDIKSKLGMTLENAKIVVRAAAAVYEARQLDAEKNEPPVSAPEG